MTNIDNLIEFLKYCTYENRLVHPNELKEIIDILENNILIPKSKNVYKIYNIDSPFDVMIEEIPMYDLTAWELLHLEEYLVFSTEEEAKNYVSNRAEW